MEGLLAKGSLSRKLTTRKEIRFTRPKLTALLVEETVWLKGSKCTRIKELAFKRLLTRECSTTKVGKLSRKIIKGM